eukprot:scpid62659/ scgid14087/ 
MADLLLSRCYSRMCAIHTNPITAVSTELGAYSACMSYYHQQSPETRRNSLAVVKAIATKLYFMNSLFKAMKKLVLCRFSNYTPEHCMNHRINDQGMGVK